MDLHFLLHILLMSICKGVSSNYSDEDRLLQDLFTKYNRHIRPVQNSSQPVQVTLRFDLIRVCSLGKGREHVTVHGWLTAIWWDSRLAWDSFHYGNLQSTIVSPNQLWVPKISLENSADNVYLREEDHFGVLIYSDGSCHWTPVPWPCHVSPRRLGSGTFIEVRVIRFTTTFSTIDYDSGIFRSICEMDTSWFPYDRQTCSLQFGSWNAISSYINLTHDRDNIGLDLYGSSNEWDLSDTSVERKTLFGGQFSQIIFNMKAKRKSNKYVATLVAPLTVLCFMSLLIFQIPASSGQKLFFSLLFFLPLSLCFVWLSQSLPTSSNTVPWIVIYFIFAFSVTASSIGLTVLFVTLRSNVHKPPAWLSRVAYFGTSGTKSHRSKVEDILPVQNGVSLALNDYSNSDKDKTPGKSQGELAVTDEKQTLAMGEILGYMQNMKGKQDAKEIQSSIAMEWDGVVIRMERICFWLYLMLFCFGTIILHACVPK